MAESGSDTDERDGERDDERDDDERDDDRGWRKERLAPAHRRPPPLAQAAQGARDGQRPASASLRLRSGPHGAASLRPASAASLRPMSASSRCESLRPAQAYRTFGRAPSRFTTVDQACARSIDHGKSILPRPQSAMATRDTARRNSIIKSVYASRPAATLFVDRSVSTQSTVFGSQPQHRRPDLGRQVLEGERGSLVYKIKAPADLNYFDQWLDRLRRQLEAQMGTAAAAELGAQWRPGSAKGAVATYVASEWQHNMAKVQTELLRRTQSQEED